MVAAMGLHLHRAERTDALADGLGALLATPPADPFTQELVLVPARGVERWLSQRLSHVLGAGAEGDGVCAGVEFRSPVSLIAEITGTGDADPWSPDALAWPLLAVIDANLMHPGVPRWQGIWAMAMPRRKVSCAAAGVTRWPGGWQGCSPLMPGNGHSCSSTGAPANPVTCMRTWPGSRRCGGP